MTTKTDAKPLWPADEVKRRPIASLKLYAKNARTHSPEQIEQIARSMGEFGWTIPILLDERGEIIAGHGRILAAAPMPGAVATIAVKPGLQVKAGDLLLTLEAMKMETSLSAPRDGKINEVLVSPGQPVDAKDLLIVMDPQP